MRKKGPKTQRGQMRKDLFGDGRISQTTAIQRELGQEKKRARKGRST